MKKEVNGKVMKRFILTVYDSGEIEDVIEGLSMINEFITPILQHPPMEAPLMSEEEEEYYEDEEYD